MFKTQTETFRGYGKLFGIAAQTAAECRFPEAETVLSAHACAHLSGAEAGNGEVRYFGRALFSIVYEDADRHVCRAEKGVEFTAVARDARIAPAQTVCARLAVENLSVRREGASIFLTALLGADLAFFGDDPSSITHVGLILAPGYILHASGHVRVDRLDHHGIFRPDLRRYTHSLRLLSRLT